MTVEEFLEKFNSVAYDLSEIAGLAAQITDNDDLANIAKAFGEIEEDLQASLDDIGFEFG